MQLRVARLCLDCEELHVEDACPICASERYAFLCNWLPSEERRRWRRPAPASPEQAPGGVEVIRRVIGRWFGVADPEHVYSGPRTRASDFAPRLDFDAPESDPPKKSPALDPQPVQARNSGVS